MRKEKQKESTSLKKIEIEKEKMVKLENKQLWLMILSHLSFEELFQISSVCKTFFFILKEEDKFWRRFFTNNFGEAELPREVSNWKQFCLSCLSFDFDEERFEKTNFKYDKKKKLLEVTASSNWLAAITKRSFIEEMMYCFEIVNLQTYNITIGVGLKKTNHLSPKSFAVDEFRFGYYSCSNTVYFGFNGVGERMRDCCSFETGERLYILVHKGSYSQEKDSEAIVSFFFQNKEAIQPKYQFTVTGFVVPKGEKLHGFVGAANISEIGVGRTLISPQNYLPQNLILKNIHKIMN